MSSILCIVDGMIDSAFDAKDYHNLSRMNLKEYAQTTPDGFSADTIYCVMNILGVNPIPQNVRGYIEALGAGIKVDYNDLLLRLTWYGVDKNGFCTTPVPALKTFFAKDYSCYNIGGNKSVMLFKDTANSLENLHTTPPYQCVGRKAEEFRPKGIKEIENFFDTQIKLGRCPVPWAQSVPVVLPKFKQKAAVICGIPKVKGIAKALDMDIVALKGATGDTDTDLKEKTYAALAAAEKYQFVLLHINGADEASHRLDLQQKQCFLQKIDREVISRLILSDHKVTVTADHGTDTVTGGHMADLQPVFTNF